MYVCAFETVIELYASRHILVHSHHKMQMLCKQYFPGKAMLYVARNSHCFWGCSSCVTLCELLYFSVLSFLFYKIELIIPNPAGRVN